MDIVSRATKHRADYHLNQLKAIFSGILNDIFRACKINLLIIHITISKFSLDAITDIRQKLATDSQEGQSVSVLLTQLESSIITSINTSLNSLKVIFYCHQSF